MSTSASDVGRDGTLCLSCRHVRTVTSSKGARFILCERAKRDVELPKYPVQPVLACRGYEQ